MVVTAWAGTVRNLIENVVVNSDNDSFIALRAAFDHDGYERIGLPIWVLMTKRALNPMSDDLLPAHFLRGYGVR